MCELGMYRTPKFAEKLGSQEQDVSFVPVVMTLSVVFASRRLGSRATVVCVEEACGRVYEHCCSTQSGACQAHWDLGRPARGHLVSEHVDIGGIPQPETDPAGVASQFMAGTSSGPTCLKRSEK